MGRKKVDGRQFAKRWMGRVVAGNLAVVGSGGCVLAGERITGWAVGYTFRRKGRVDELNSFVSTGESRPVALVCRWPGRKSVDVLIDTLELSDSVPTTDPLWGEHARRVQAEYMSEHRRDASGRLLRLLPE